MVRVLVAAPYPMTRAGLAALLQAEPDLEVAGTVGDSAALVDQSEALAPNVILLDAGDEPDRWLDDLSRLLGTAGPPPVLLLAGDLQVAGEALRGGVTGLLLRDATSEEVAQAVRAAALGLVVLDRRATAALTNPPPPAQPSGESALVEPLTHREREILQLIAQGLPNKAIAAELRISEHTVKFHVGSILDKLGASSRSEALARAARAGLIIL